MSLSADNPFPVRFFYRGLAASLVTLVLMFSFGASAQMGMDCGSLANGYGPYDYSNATHRRAHLPIVERYHFDIGVQNLTGSTVGGSNLSQELDYTLRAFPNHHKALYSVIRYDLSDDPRHRQPLSRSADCYLLRAMTWQPFDGKVRLLYGIYKSRKGELEAAKEMFAEAERLMPESAEVHYNIGLVLAKAGEYDEALRHAHSAYAMGYPMPGLRNILKRAGQWKDPAPQSQESDS